MRFNDRSMALLGVPDLPTEAFKHAGDRRIKPQGGGGGGQSAPTPTQNTSYTTNIPEYAKPYVETMLGATQKQLFQGTPTGDGGFDITGFQPYKAYGGTYDESGNQTSYDPGRGIAGFQPMQTTAQQGIANMQVPDQYRQAMGLTGAGIGGALGTAGQGVGLTGMGYEAANAGNQYAQQATNPYATQAYMSPYMQNVVDVQQREAQRQADIAGTQRNAQAVQAGAFGGSRQALTDAEAARNLALQKGDIQATGLQSAYQQAQQAQQYGANLGLQGMQAGMAGVGAGIGAQQAAYNQAMQGANQLAGLGSQQLASQQGIYNLQNQTGAQQQALEQQKLNQAMQDYSNAQQYPLMQLGTMSNMIRGLPMQASTTQQYQAQPSLLTQGIGAVGAATSLANAFGGRAAAGGLPKEFKKSGIMSYNVGGEIESSLEDADDAYLQKQLKESSSPSVKRMAQRILRERQMEGGPRMAGGGIIAFAGPTEENNQSLVTEPTSSEILQQRVMQGKPTGDVMAQPQGIVQAAPVAPKPPPTALEAAQADPNLPDVLKSQIADQQARANRSIQDIMAEKQAAYAAAGLGGRNPEERANLMKERANAEDEANRNRWLQAAAFFAKWGSTPGPTLVAGLAAVRDRVPDIVENEKEARKIRTEINKSIASLDEATRLEKRGKIDEAAAIKEKDAGKMQELYLKLSDYEMQAKKEAAAQKKMEVQEELKSGRAREHDIAIERMRRDLQDSVNKTTLEAEKIRAGAQREAKGAQNEANMLARVTAAATLQANVDRTIEGEKSKPAYADLLRQSRMPESPDTLPIIAAAKQELQKKEDSFDRMRREAKETVDYVKNQAGMTVPKAETTTTNRPQPKGAAARGADARPTLSSFQR